MNFVFSGRKAFLAAAILPMLAQGVFAQEIAQSHLDAARAAVKSLNATDQFDRILPTAAETLRQELLKKDPNLSDQITTIITDQTVALASRRSDLEAEAARVYARVFSEEELKAISAFYETPAGLKLMKEAPILVRELVKAANIWQDGIARDLAQNVGAELTKVAPSLPVPEGEAAAPAQGG
jgi:uncharacterized protein